MKFALVFPGQGSQSVGMMAAYGDAPVIRATFDEASAALGRDLWQLVADGPAEALSQTVNTQPLMLTAGIAVYRFWLDKGGPVPAMVAGHSLGEYSACVAAGAMSFEDALRVTSRRGELMYAAGLERPGAMAAVLGLSREDVEAACAEGAAAGIVRAANLNAPGQVVISGEPAAVDAACEAAKARGAKRAIRLEVSGAFHSPLMASAAAGLAEALESVEIRDADCPIVSNAWARPVRTSTEIRAALKEQLLASVRWEESMRSLLEAGVEGFVELGTGKVLRGLLRTIHKEAASWNVEDPESLQATLAALGSAAGRSA